MTNEIKQKILNLYHQTTRAANAEGFTAGLNSGLAVNNFLSQIESLQEEEMNTKEIKRKDVKKSN